MRKLFTVLIVFLLLAGISACNASGDPGKEDARKDTPEEGEKEEKKEAAEPNGDIYILYTSDVHCGVDEGFGYAGLQSVRDSLEAQGYTTILVDNGDSIQGDPLGTLSRGEEIIRLMNAMHYDVATPGNHEFDYGMEQFLKLTEMADFPYISCNFNKQGERVFPSYVILERAGKKIAFVGVTTPETLTTSTPDHFRNEEGEFIYGFLADGTGETLCAALQEAVDQARAEGADFVYCMAHMGMGKTDALWTYPTLIAGTSGIDVVLDGHSHDTEQAVMLNKDGQEVARSAAGTKLSCIGYSHISKDGETIETGIWSWPNDDAAPELFGIDNTMAGEVKKARENLNETLKAVVAHTEFDLTINDPVAIDGSGNPVRIVRRMETNLGDLCADALRSTGAEITLYGGGGVRATIQAGDITYGDMITVMPFGNYICVIEATGQQILDALEWGCRLLPRECGGFLQVSGLSYEIDMSVESSCVADDNNMFVSVEGERRVRNVLVGEEAIDPQKTYTVAGTDYWLLSNGDGYTMFDGAKVLQNSVIIDNQCLMEYIMNDLGGAVGEEYADPYGQGRIRILNGE